MSLSTIDAAFNRQLVEKMPDLRRYARRLTGNAADAEDLLQDCLLRAMLGWHRFQPGTNLRAWLFTVMHNLHISSYRRHTYHEMTLAPDELATVAATRPPAQESAVEMRDFLRAFGRLSQARQETILMIGWDGMSYDAAASCLGVPTGTVRSRLSRARAELRKAMRCEPTKHAHGRTSARFGANE